jgi:Na+-transporting NADH:ubiquinone oxidoreductase subunit NqrC
MENTNKKTFTADTIWKIVMTILVILLSIFFIFGLIGRAIQVMLKNQAKKVDKLMSKLVVAKVVNNEKDFKRIANYKSRVYFFKHAIAPVCILLVTLILWLVCMLINGWNESMFPIFGRMLYPRNGLPVYIPPLGFDFSGITTNYVDMSNWFNVCTLITIILLFIGTIYYFVEVSGFIARKRRIRKLCDQMFSKNLDDVDLTSFLNTTNSTILNVNKKAGNNVPAVQSNQGVANIYGSNNNPNQNN